MYNIYLLINGLIYICYLIYYFYILKYINDLKDIEICNNINQPYLNIFYGIISFMIIFSIFNFVIPKKYLINLIKFIFKFKIPILLIFLIANLLIFKLLFNISKQQKCKDISPNFRTFIFYMVIINIIINILNIFTIMNTKELNKKDKKLIQLYLKEYKKLKK